MMIICLLLCRLFAKLNSFLMYVKSLNFDCLVRKYLLVLARS